MIEKLAIIIIVLLNQSSAILESQNETGFWNQFVKEETINSRPNLQKENWSYYDNAKIEKNISQPLPGKIEGAADFNVNAKSAVVLDVGTNTVLYSKNSDKNLPIASLTKIITALVVLDNTDPGEIVTISQKAFNTEGSKNGLAVEEKITAKNLFKVMLVNSNNIAANAFAEHISGNTDNFVKLMNEKADLIGLKNTKFLNPSGLDSAKGDNISTAYEVSQLVNYALEKPLIWETLRIQRITVTSVDGKIEHHLKNTNLLLGKLENIFGGKTGLTDEAGQCLVLIIGDPDDNHKIISVVLNADDRFSETEKLVRWVFENYEW